MNRPKARVRAVAAASVCVASLAALAASADDLTIVWKVTQDNQPPATHTSYLSSDHVRMVESGGQEFMFDAANGRITVIDNKKKQYSVMTQQDIEAMKAQIEQQVKAMEPQMKQMHEQLEKMPPEMRQKMQGMMGGMGDALSVSKGTGTRKIAGYTCEPWTVSFGALSKTETCLTNDLPLPMQVWDKYRDFAQSMQGMLQAMGPMGQGLGKMQEKLKEMKGYPLARTSTTSVMGRASTTTGEVTEIRKGPIPASAWELPAGYKQVESPLKAMGGRKK